VREGYVSQKNCFLENNHPVDLMDGLRNFHSLGENSAPKVMNYFYSTMIEPLDIAKKELISMNLQMFEK